MDLFMPLQQVLLDEAHVTLTAPERPLTCAIQNIGSNLTVNVSLHYKLQYKHVFRSCLCIGLVMTRLSPVWMSTCLRRW